MQMCESYTVIQEYIDSSYLSLKKEKRKRELFENKWRDEDMKETEENLEVLKNITEVMKIKKIEATKTESPLCEGIKGLFENFSNQQAKFETPCSMINSGSINVSEVSSQRSVG